MKIQHTITELIFMHATVMCNCVLAVFFFSNGEGITGKGREGVERERNRVLNYCNILQILLIAGTERSLFGF